jgi:hypothetical protein
LTIRAPIVAALEHFVSMALSAMVATLVMTVTMVLLPVVVATFVIVMAVVTPSIVPTVAVALAVMTSLVVPMMIVTATVLLVLAVLTPAALVRCAALPTHETRTRTGERAARGLGRIHLPQSVRVEHVARFAFASALLAEVIREVVRGELLGRLTGARSITVLRAAGNHQGRSEHAAESRERG